MKPSDRVFSAANFWARFELRSSLLSNMSVGTKIFKHFLNFSLSPIMVKFERDHKSIFSLAEGLGVRK